MSTRPLPASRGKLFKHLQELLPAHPELCQDGTIKQTVPEVQQRDAEAASDQGSAAQKTNTVGPRRHGAAVTGENQPCEPASSWGHECPSFKAKWRVGQFPRDSELTLIWDPIFTRLTYKLFSFHTKCDE